MTIVDPKTTALVLIDIQQGILPLPLTPLTSEELASQGKKLAEQFRAAGAPVVLVNVSWSPDFGDALMQPVDAPMQFEGGLPANFDALAPGLAQEGDIFITKRQWGAFTGTELDLQLRRRGIKTVVIGGVSTNMGVESTARHAYELNYAVIIAKQATTGMDQELHDMAMNKLFPLFTRVADSISFE
ncbi:hydrolase [Sphingobium sp. EM0848]|uniref:hydrolase n=1 Tax=Sphingobium sp. EM0848 TaxID=2743473 RepID=UPI00159C87AF